MKNRDRQSLRRQAVHYLGFLHAGLAALATDIIVLSVLSHYGGMNVYLARVISIFFAMVVSWWINRHVTFAVKAPPSFNEFARFAAVSWVAQAVNYAVFAAILITRPSTPVPWAVAAASVIAMFVSYAGFRFGVFRQKSAGNEEGSNDTDSFER